MEYLQRLFWAVAGLFTLAVIGVAVAPKVRAAIRAAFVEVVLPSQPFSGTMVLKNEVRSIGPGTGTLGVSSLTITNFNTTQQQIQIFPPELSGGGCGVGTVTGGGSPSFNFLLPPRETIHVSYPSPLVFPTISGHTCIAGEVTTVNTAEVDVLVNGFVN